MTKRFSLVVGIVAFVAGVFSFIPNFLVGASGFFASNGLTGAILIILGIIFISVAYKEDSAIARFYKAMSIVFIVASAIFFLLSGSAGSGTQVGIAFNTADCWLGLVLGITLIALSEKISARLKASAPIQKK